MHAAPGFVASSWGTEMPTPLRWLVRALQVVGGRSLLDCGEYLVAGMTHAERTHGFWLLDEFGASGTAHTVPEHEAAQRFLWEHIRKVVAAGRSVA